MSALSDYSTTAASNNSAAPNGAPEGMLPSSVNDTMRQMMANMKGALTFVESSGTDTYTATLAPAPAAYSTNMIFAVRIGTTNTSTTPTLNINSLGAKTITSPSGAAVAAGDLNGDHLFSYDGTYLRVLNPRSAGSPLLQGLHTIWVPALAMVARTTNGAAAGTAETTTNKVMLKTLDFDASTIEYAQFAIRMPKSWNEGTVTAAFTWSHAATTTNFKISWGLQGVALSDDDAGDTAFGTAQYSNDTGGTTDDVYVSPTTSAITIAGSPAAEDWVVYQVLRKADDGTNDTLAVDGRLHGVTLYCTLDAGTDA